MQVIDTNVLAYLLIEGDGTAACRDLYERDSDWRSESFLLVEFSNVLATCLRGGFLREGEAVGLLAEGTQLLSAGLESIPHTKALRMAKEFGVSAYDARFLAVASRLGAKLVTEDSRLRAAAPDLTQSLAEALEE